MGLYIVEPYFMTRMVAYKYHVVDMLHGIIGLSCILYFLTNVLFDAGIDVRRSMLVTFE